MSSFQHRMGDLDKPWIIDAMGSGVAVGDYDNDGDDDIYFVNARPHYLKNDPNWTNALYRNEAGVFTNVTEITGVGDTGYGMCAVFGDVDNDGWLDLFVGNYGPNTLYRNNGDGTFSDVTSESNVEDDGYAASASFADVDRDGDFDLLAAFTQTVGKLKLELFLNDGKGVFRDAASGRIPSKFRNPSFLFTADLDRDGDLDILIFTSENSLALLVNNGKGFFKENTGSRIPSALRSSMPLLFSDLDGDGAPDLLLREEDVKLNGWRIHLLWNDGKGSFKEGTFPLPWSPAPLNQAGPSIRALAADFDRDGDRDLLISSYGLDLLFQGGRRTFTSCAECPVPLPAPGFQWTFFFSGDLDGDGEAELLVRREKKGSPPVPMVLDGDGFGSYRASSRFRLPDPRQGFAPLALGDVDGDGDLDVIVEYESGRTGLWVNDGAGNFKDGTAGNMPPSDGIGQYLGRLADLDGDGDLDLVLASGSFFFTVKTYAERIYLNDGKGRFTDATAGRLEKTRSRIRALALGDFDGDGDLDLLVKDCCNPRNYLVTNRLRHLSAPWFFRPLRPARLDWSGTPGAALLPMLSVKPGKTTPTPLGTLRLGTSGLFVLPCCWLSPLGKTSTWFAVPWDPALMGGKFYAQGLVLPWGSPSSARFTNARKERIRSF